MSVSKRLVGLFRIRNNAKALYVQHYSLGKITSEEINIQYCRRIAKLYEDKEDSHASEERLFYLLLDFSHAFPLTPMKGP